MRIIYLPQPLVQYSASVRDSLLLVLRKSLFSRYSTSVRVLPTAWCYIATCVIFVCVSSSCRQVEVRKIAVSGYLLLLRKFKVSGHKLPAFTGQLTSSEMPCSLVAAGSGVSWC